jgi:O-antigen ligase
MHYTSSAIDDCAVVVLLACIYSAIVGPLVVYSSTAANIRSAEPGIPNRIFWPILAAVSIIIIARNYSRFSQITFPPHIIFFFVYVGFAGASVAWAFNPEIALTRYTQQLMVLTSIVFPALLAQRSVDLMRGTFLCFAAGAVLNAFFLLNNSPAIVNSLNGYPGYLIGKNYLGEFAAVTLLMALHEVTYSRLRRAIGVVIVGVAILLLVCANSKTSLGLALFVPMLAGLTLIIRRSTGISPAVLLLLIPLVYMVLSNTTGFNMNRISYILYGDPTFTGRTIIWEFAALEIAKRSLLGWGYQSFWLVGMDAPSVVDAPGFVKMMPNGHNGYWDTTLELGRVGYALLLIFLVATLHAIGRVADRDFARAWLVLSLVLFVICYNYFESLWLRGFEFLWVLFVIVITEIARYWKPEPMSAVRIRPGRRPSNAGGVRGRAGRHSPAGAGLHALGRAHAQ